ncbi:MAG: SoxR reducing system RseC family protein [Spirochaetaceae bacterium]
MIEKAIVIRTEGERVILACQSQGCKSCSSMFCASGGDRREFTAVNPRGVALKTADEVEFYVEPGRAILAGFLVLVMPLLAFAAAYFAVGGLLEEPSEQVRVLSGLGGLFLGFGVAYLLGRRGSRYPVVLARPEEINLPTT